MEKDKVKRIKAELKRISCYFEDLPESRKAVILPLLQNSAFMKVTLEDLQQIINEEGVVDEYQNGANQFGKKQSATLQSYNQLVKNYASVTKALQQCMPVEKPAIQNPFAIDRPEPTEEEIEEQRRQEDERLKQLNEEIQRAQAELERRRQKKDA